MAGLIQGLKTFGGNLLDFAGRYGSMTYGPEGASEELAQAAGPEAEAARRNYDRNFRAARWKSIRAGGGLGEVDDAGHVYAQEQYGRELMQAVQVAEALKQRRLESGRTAKIAEYFKNATDLTPQQRTVFEALPPDKAAELMKDREFASLNAKGDAVHSTMEGANGNLWIVGNDGTMKDTKIPYNQTTSEMRTMIAFATQDQVREGARVRSFADKYGEQSATFQAEVEATLPVIMRDASSSVMELNKLRNELRSLGTGRLVGPALEQVSAKMQAIHAQLNERALLKIGELKQKGVSLQPITEKELAELKSTSASIGNLPAANIEIIDRQINTLNRVISEIEDQLRWIDEGKPALSYRPRKYREGRGEDDGIPPPPDGAVRD
jgi:hypothetical protein